MKVGTDGVLLGAWCGVASLGPDASVLDVGCGTGLIALMVAQRSRAGRIDAVDIDPQSVQEAAENFAASPWKERLRIRADSFQSYARTCGIRYDYIVSNPPYFVNSLKNPDRGRAVARHSDALPFAELVGGVCRLLASDGCFALILPGEESLRFEREAGWNGLYPCRRLKVYSTPESPLRRILTEFSRRPADCETRSLVIGADGPRQYSEEYRQLTADFYLKF